VLEHLRVDVPSLCSAGRAHSRLHAAAVQAITAVTLLHGDCTQRWRLLRKLRYLAMYGMHVRSLEINCVEALSSSELSGACHAVPRLTQLVLRTGRDSGIDWLVTAHVCAHLPQLGRLQRLDWELGYSAAHTPGLAPALAPLTQLTHLRLSVARGSFDAQPLAAAAASLRQLEVVADPDSDVTLHHLSALVRLTGLSVESSSTASARDTVAVDAAGLGRVRQLQALSLSGVDFRATDGKAAAFLQELAQLQRLARLGLHRVALNDGSGPGELFAALTASSSLRELTMLSAVPAAAWYHVFAAGTCSQHLTSLELGGWCGAAAAHVVCLDSLQELSLPWDELDDAQLLQLTCMRQLVVLSCVLAPSGTWRRFAGPPCVWRQLLHFCAHSENAHVRLQATAMLALEARAEQLEAQLEQQTYALEARMQQLEEQNAAQAAALNAHSATLQEVLSLLRDAHAAIADAEHAGVAGGTTAARLAGRRRRPS
jgi:hypothetical protein